MNRFILCLLLSFVVFNASSQKIYFVYLQSEEGQPFYVKMNDRIMSSTGSGYLILSRLRDSSYSFNVGFPENKWPEQRFSVGVNRKDHGYVLKNFGEKGWGLFDLQTMGVQMASIEPVKPVSAVVTEKKEVTAFTELLSKAADDSTLKEKPIVEKVEEAKIESNAEQKDSIVQKEPVMINEDPKTEIKEPPVTKIEGIAETKDSSNQKIENPVVKEPEAPYKPSTVIKKSESSTTEGFGLVFIDDYGNGVKDTIRILIPNTRKPEVKDTIKAVIPEEKKFLDISTDTSKTITPVIEVKKPVVIETPVTKSPLNNNCKEIATDDDFFKLRRKMAAETTDDAMVSEAKKYFKTKCFTVAQVKNLSSMFLNEAGKYQFFDASYPIVSDPANFASLQSELKEEYYINRFKAMLR